MCGSEVLWGRHGEGSELGASVDGVVSTDTVGECAVRAAQGSSTQQRSSSSTVCCGAWGKQQE